MSFEFNSVATFKPKVENTFLGKGGGGGKTGYFRQGKKKKDEDNSILSAYLSEDKLEKMATEAFETETKDGIMDKFKGFLGKIV